ncbi:hypothetical protein [Paenibacillus donghaensis]|uniref:Uncharacterized protein n=1 Tax=Paenibacillus donghaensis TaxID=414771 RepID=A0A2Z2KN43_9BACL|nr:hypothetical protein [Paenibacillus donghaensis]ASA24019.1 hypothetical protein B9T62_26485 [Paenibacillus donghaensis]
MRRRSSYAAQLLLQTGAWSSLIDLYRQGGLSLLWCRLPQPLLHGLLQAPASVRKQWCRVYTGRQRALATPADCAEWLVARRWLAREAEPELGQAGGCAAAVGLAYRKLLRAEELAPQLHAQRLSGSIPWLLLARSPRQTEDTPIVMLRQVI